jgi:hypothetical protein
MGQNLCWKETHKPDRTERTYFGKNHKSKRNRSFFLNFRPLRTYFEEERFQNRSLLAEHRPPPGTEAKFVGINTHVGVFITYVGVA